MCKVYARQVNPEYQDAHLFYISSKSREWVWEDEYYKDIAFMPLRGYYDTMPADVESVRDVLEAGELADVLDDIQRGPGYWGYDAYDGRITKALDPSRRYRVENATWDYDYTVNAVPLDSKGLPVKYHQPAHRLHEEPAPADCFDKSGYLTYDRRENLRRRAQALREERAKAAYLASDKQQEQIEELCGLIAIRQMELVESLTVANTSQEFMAVAKAIGEYSWNSFSGIVSDYETFCEKTRNKSYPSIEDSDRAYNKIKTSLLIELKRIAAA